MILSRREVIYIQTREPRGRPLNVVIFDKTKSSSISVFLAHPSSEIHASLSMLSKQLKGFRQLRKLLKDHKNSIKRALRNKNLLKTSKFLTNDKMTLVTSSSQNFNVFLLLYLYYKIKINIYLFLHILSYALKFINLGLIWL